MRMIDAEENRIGDLLQQAKQAALHSYSPYSGLSVGCALRTDDGRIFSGCNVENASYGSTMCAEANATGTAIASGAKRIVEVIVVSTAPGPIPPCGNCRQILYEFGKDATVYCGSLQSESVQDLEKYGLRDLLPFVFEFPED